MLNLLIIIIAAAVLVVLGCCKVSGDCAEEERQAQKACPCDTCVRWSECNGVDTECPLL